MNDLKKIIYRLLQLHLFLLTVVAIPTSCKTGNKSQADELKDKDQKQRQLIVFAAASLTGVISEIADSFEVKHQAVVKLNLASSGTLIRQMEQGAKPDVFLSASRQWANYADSSGLILPESKKEIITNELVLIAPVESPISNLQIDSNLNLPALVANERLAIGDPAHVPAGQYAQQALEYYGWYNQLQKNLLQTKDVRSALMMVEMEEAPLGIVYYSDAIKSKKVRVTGTFPEESHKPIVYIGALCNDNKLTKDFFDYLQSDEMKTIWKKHGFRKLNRAKHE